MQKIKSSYNKIMTGVTPFVTALVVLSLLLSGAILLEWLNVENPTGLGYFLLAQGIALMVRNFK